jgi:hypothetical protein
VGNIDEVQQQRPKQADAADSVRGSLPLVLHEAVEIITESNEQL